MAHFKSKYIKELSNCRDPGRQLELIVAINKNGLLYEDLSLDIKKFYNLPVIDEGIDVVVLDKSYISEVYQCKNTTKMIIGAHELGTFFNLYLHILKKHVELFTQDDFSCYKNFPKKFIVGNLNTKFRDTIDDIIRIDVEEELKKYLPNNIKHIREMIQYEFGGDLGFLHSINKNSVERQEYQIRVNEWFSGLSKIFRLVVDDKELFNETKTDDFIKKQCSKIIELKKSFEINPYYEDNFTKLNIGKDWLIKLRKVITEMNFMTITLPNSSIGYLLNINSKYNTYELNKIINDISTRDTLIETVSEHNKTGKFKIVYNNLHMYIDKNINADFYYDDELSKIIHVPKKHYWLIDGWF